MLCNQLNTLSGNKENEVKNYKNLLFVWHEEMDNSFVNQFWAYEGGEMPIILDNGQDFCTSTINDLQPVSFIADDYFTNNLVAIDKKTSFDIETPIKLVQSNAPNIEIIENHVIKPAPQTNAEDLVIINEKLILNDHIEIVSAHKCKLCDSLFEHYDDIVNHLKTCMNKTENLYLCGLCQDNIAPFDSLETLKLHMLSSHNLAPKTIEIPNETSVEEDDSKIDIVYFQKLLANQTLANRKVKCILSGCKNRFSCKEIMLKHLDCHFEGQKKKFKCGICDKHFYVWRTCKNHMWNIHKVDIGLLECPICKNFKSLAPYHLLVHMKTHNHLKDTSNVLCSTCGMQFKKLAQLLNHIKTHNKQNKCSDGSIECSTCKNTFSNSKILKRHIQAVHAAYKPFICNICGHKSGRKSMLELHLRQHTGEKPYKCDLCAFKTGDHNSFRRHTSRHVGIKNYSCPYCSFKTIQSYSYKTHLKKHHPGKEGIFTCNHCSYTTVNKKLYEVHIKKHNDTNKNTSLEAIQENTFKHKPLNVEDEETHIDPFSEHLVEDATLDTGGITIPAET